MTPSAVPKNLLMEMLQLDVPEGTMMKIALSMRMCRKSAGTVACNHVLCLVSCDLVVVSSLAIVETYVSGIHLLL